jgi:hypothetical protein
MNQKRLIGLGETVTDTHIMNRFGPRQIILGRLIRGYVPLYILHRRQTEDNMRSPNIVATFCLQNALRHWLHIVFQGRFFLLITLLGHITENVLYYRS